MANDATRTSSRAEHCVPERDLRAWRERRGVSGGARPLLRREHSQGRRQAVSTARTQRSQPHLTGLAAACLRCRFQAHNTQHLCVRVSTRAEGAPAAREPEVGGANYVATMPRVVSQRREREYCPGGGEGGQSVVASSEARARMSAGCKAVQQPVWWWRRWRRRVPGTAPPRFLTPELP